MSIATIHHLCIVFPYTFQKIIIFNSYIRVCHIIWNSSVIMINKTSHTETFIIYNTITEIDSINALITYLFINSIPISISIYIVFRIINAIRIHIWTLEKVNSYSRRLIAISFYLTCTIYSFTIITIP